MRRREFLAMAAGAGALAAADSSGYRRRAPRPARLNLAVIGAGGRGASLLTDAAKENLVAFCDVDAQRLDQAGKKYPQARTYADFRILIAEEKDLHGVVVATPDHTHAPAAAFAMNRGLDVFCEKPLCHSVGEARLLARIAARTGAITQLGIQGHAAQKQREAIEILRSGALGDVREAHVWSNRPIWPTNVDRPAAGPACPPHLNWDLWLGPAPDRPYSPAYVPFKWRGWWDFGTGAIGDMGSHTLNPVVRGLDLGAPTTVEVEGPDPHPDSFPAWTIARYEFPARGERPPVKVTWYDGRKQPPAELFLGGRVQPNGALIVGEKGTLYLPNEQANLWSLLPAENFTGYTPPEPRDPAPPSHFEEWTAACKRGRLPSCHFQWAGPFTETLLLATVAFRAGGKIRWDAPALQTDRPDADRFLRREYRTGWAV